VRISTYSVAALQGPPGIDYHGVDVGPAGQLGVGAAFARVAPGLRSIANQHDDIETWVIVAGEGMVYADAERQPVSANMVVQFEPFETHFVDNTGDTDLVVASFFWRDGDRSTRIATGVDHRRFSERPVFVFSSPDPDGATRRAAGVFVRYLRMTGTDAWHVAAAAPPDDALEAFAGRVAASASVTAGHPPTLRLHELRADVEAHHRLGRIPAVVKEVARRAFAGDRLEVALTRSDEPAPGGDVATARIDRAFAVLHAIEEEGRRLGRDWRAGAPQGEWKIVHFLGPDAVFERAVVHPVLYRLAHPEWTPDVDYHVLEDQAIDTPVEAWGRWLDDLGTRVEAGYGGVVRDAGTWPPEHTAFLARLDNRLSAMAVCYGPDGFSLDRAAETLRAIVDDATSFARAQAPLAGIETWSDDARTSIALELAAARLLAACGAPLLPAFAARLAAALGEPAPTAWPGRVGLVKPGTRVELAGRSFTDEPPDGPDGEPSPLLPWLAGLVRGVLRLAEDAPVERRTLVSLGMESLQAIALQYQVLEQVGADVTIEDLLGTRDVAALAAFIASGLAPEVVAAHAGEVPA